ncbi:class I mannose-6-phosphate isomerase [Nonomuraea sp. M3C6]|uniref:Class I mannose-6-phosphate isomerase n=1 Tax=Nonomuraea marmarensis TaxID=3351344 RepID=A0ABW7AK98_9ACTN
MHPLVLGPNQPPERFYLGGEKIARFRGREAADPRTPEDWIGSVTTVFGAETLGLTRLPGREWLRDAVARDPVAWLGPEHVGRFGDDPLLLVKLLDAGQRLPVHSHPGTAFARRHLGRAHGKAEAWLILEGGTIHLGFESDLDRTTLDQWVRDQDVDSMLAAMNEVEVGPGDTIFVPAGVPHAIGAGVFLIELQEPEDLSVLMEWTGFAVDGPAEGHLGLGFDLALSCVDRTATGADGLVRRRAMAAPGSVLVHEADPFFRAELVRVDGHEVVEPGYGVLVVTGGEGSLAGSGQAPIPMHRGTTVLVPHAAGALSLTGRLDLVRCLPPSA